MTDLRGVAADLAPAGILRASVNLGNPVLAQGTPRAPAGVSVDLAHAIGERLGLAVETVCFDAARASFAALRDGDADLGFLAIDATRAEEVAFTAAYVVIEGVYVVHDDSPVRTPADVDRPGVRVGVKEGSAYDLHLTRSLEHATLVRGVEGSTVFLEGVLDAGAGIRQPITRFVAEHPGLRLVDERFMQIEQAVGVARSKAPETLRFLRALVEELKASGFVRARLDRAGQPDVQVAPPAS